MVSYINSLIMIHLTSLFLLSGLGKLFSYKAFLIHVHNYNFMSKRQASIVSPFIPTLELLGAFLLVSPLTWQWGVITLSGLILIFTVSIVSILKQGRNITCGCYGNWINGNVDLFTLIKNVYLLTLLTSICFTIPKFGTSLSIFSIATGIIVTSLMLTTHYAWHRYKERMKILRASKLVN